MHSTCGSLVYSRYIKAMGKYICIMMDTFMYILSSYMTRVHTLDDKKALHDILLLLLLLPLRCIREAHLTDRFEVVGLSVQALWGTEIDLNVFDRFYSDSQSPLTSFVQLINSTTARYSRNACGWGSFLCCQHNRFNANICAMRCIALEKPFSSRHCTCFFIDIHVFSGWLTTQCRAHLFIYLDCCTSFRFYVKRIILHVCHNVVFSFITHPNYSNACMLLKYMHCVPFL